MKIRLQIELSYKNKWSIFNILYAIIFGVFVFIKLRLLTYSISSINQSILYYLFDSCPTGKKEEMLFLLSSPCSRPRPLVRSEVSSPECRLKA